MAIEATTRTDSAAGADKPADSKAPKKRTRRRTKKKAATGTASTSGQATAEKSGPASGKTKRPRRRKQVAKSSAATADAKSVAAAGQPASRASQSEAAPAPKEKEDGAAGPAKKKSTRGRGGKRRKAAGAGKSKVGELVAASTAPVAASESPPAEKDKKQVEAAADKPAEKPASNDARTALAERAAKPALLGRFRLPDAEFGAGLEAPPPPPPPPLPAEEAVSDAPRTPGSDVPDAKESAAESPPAKAAPKRRRRGKRTGKAAAAASRELPEPDLDDSDEDDSPSEPGSSDYEMIINVSAGDECRIAVLLAGRLEELYIERQSAESHVGSIFKGRVTNVEPSIQAVFVDFGQTKNGFLHISDVHPQYFPNGGPSAEEVGRKIPRRDRPLIQKCFRRGQEVVVQVTKEGVGTKGPTLTSYLSIPGRFLVMMPGMKRLGVSRKIEDDDDRRSMREVLNQLDLPDGMGFILRTAGMGRTKRELQRDLNYLNRLWKIVAKRLRTTRAPSELYQESDLVIRTMRDVLSSDFKRIVVDDADTAEKVREFLKIALPRTPDLVEEYADTTPIFHKFGIEAEIDKINSRKVPLPLGGSIVIEQTEAMVAIDVNSGKFRDVADPEESAYKINLQAAEEIARQLRLRDLGGLVVCDFIDLRDERRKRAVERCLRNELKKHKERARILRMSQFGLIEMTRQRQRSSIRQSIFCECPHCHGTGMLKSAESMALEVMRILQMAAHRSSVKRVTMSVCPDVATLVQNTRRAQLHNLEQQTQTTIVIRSDPLRLLDEVVCECEDERGRVIPAPA